MFKKICLLFAVSSLCYANTNVIRIEDIFKTIDFNSFESKLEDLTKKINNEQEKVIKLGNYNGVLFESSYNRSIFEKGNITDLISLKTVYGPFFLSLNRNKVSDKNVDLVSVGLEKNVKELFLSRKKYEMEKLERSKKLKDIEFKTLKNKKKEQVIDIYTEILNLKEELSLKNNFVETLLKYNKILNKSYELGSIPKIELETNNIDLESLKLDINILKDKISTLNKIIFNGYNIDLSKYKLEDLDIGDINKENIFKNYANNEINKVCLEKELISIEADYLYKKDVLPDLIVGYNHKRVISDIGNLGDNEDNKNQHEFYVKFRKQLFFSNAESKISNLNSNIKEEELNNLKTQIKNERERLKLEYDSMEKNIEFLKSKANLEYKKYIIKEKEFELNSKSYMEVSEAYNKYLGAKIDAVKAKNNFNAFLYKKNLNSIY